MKKVLILDANQRCALAVTRSLGKHKIHIITADETSNALASASKFSQQHFTYPSAQRNSQAFIDAVSQFVKQQKIDILLPMTELTTTLLLMHQTEFANAILPFPTMQTVNSLADKCQLMQMAKQLGVPIPKTIYVQTPDELPCQLNELTYPVVLKPGKSWIFYDDKWDRAAVRFAQTPEEAQTILNTDWAFQAHSFMIQECVEGHGAGVFTLYNKGKALAFFAHQRLREKPLSGGVSVLSQSVPVDPKLKHYAEKLLENVNWHGVAMVEFKISPCGTPYLMEINTRFWGSLQLAIDAGIDFPHLLYQTSCHQHPEPVGSYQKNIRLRWLLGDLDNLYLTWKSKKLLLSDKIKASIGFLLPNRQKTNHEINRLSDFNPALFELKTYVLSLFGKK